MAWHELDDVNILFYGRDVIVVAKHFSSQRCVVTFTSRVSDKDMPTAPFGASMLEKDQCSYICFISTSNHWWQTSEFHRALERCKVYLDRSSYKELIAYGGSMGGVGVLQSSAILQPDFGIIFGAQYDISPDVVPWDTRWHDDAKELKISLEDGNRNASKTTEFIYIYDNFSIDKRHINLLKEHVKISPLCLPFSGHETFRCLKEAGISGEVAKCLLLSNDSISDRVKLVRELYRANRTKSKIFWRNLALFSAQSRRGKFLEYCSNRLRSFPDIDLSTFHALGNIYLSAKSEPASAEVFFDAAIAMDSVHPAAWRGKVKCRQVLGDFDAAVEFGIAALARSPASADLCRVLIEASFHAKNRCMLAISAKYYVEKNLGNKDESFFRRHVSNDIWECQIGNAKDLIRFESILKLIRTRKPNRYTQLLHCLIARTYSTIIEIGVFDGTNSGHMIEAAKIGSEPEADLNYIGFDLFEDMAPDVHEKEFSKYPLSQVAVKEKLSVHDVDVQLIKGYTQVTIADFARDRDDSSKISGFVFLDGGHSEETIEADWHNILSVLSPQSIVIFDDYYVNKPEALMGFGCNSLIERLSEDARYIVETMPVHDKFDKEFGVLTVAMVRVRFTHHVCENDPS